MPNLTRLKNLSQDRLARRIAGEVVEQTIRRTKLADYYDYLVTGRHDPYKGYRFRVEIDGLQVAGFHTVGGLSFSSDVNPYREGGVNFFAHNLPGPVSWEPITLVKGFTDNIELWEWAISRFQLEQTLGSTAPRFRRNLVISLLDNDMFTSVSEWTVYGAWVSAYNISPMQAMVSEVMMRSVTLAHSGWQESPTKDSKLFGLL